MANISQLGALLESDAIDLDTYVDTKRTPFQLPAKGRYSLRAPESFPPEAFSATRAGYLLAQVDPTIVGPAHEGFLIRFVKVSAKPFRTGGMSWLGLYLRACGQTGTIPGDPQSQADAIERTAGTVYEADLDWRAQKGDFALEGMEKFPKNEDGTHQSWIEHPTEKDENGAPLRLRANLVITKFYAPGQ